MYSELKQKEYKIMKYIWNEQEGVSFGEIHDYANQLGKELTRQRVNCFIQSLINKGFIQAEGEDRHKIYSAIISKEEYDNYIANDLLNQLFDSSIKKFISALSGGDKLSDQTAKELKQILKKNGGKK